MLHMYASWCAGAGPQPQDISQRGAAILAQGKWQHTPNAMDPDMALQCDNKDHLLNAGALVTKLKQEYEAAQPPVRNLIQEATHKRRNV